MTCPQGCARSEVATGLANGHRLRASAALQPFFMHCH